jgi:alpha-glucosidase
MTVPLELYYLIKAGRLLLSQSRHENHSSSNIPKYIVMKDVIHTYPEPKPILCNDPRIEQVSSTKIAVDTVLGIPLEIEFLEGVGWSLEVRYDLIGTDIARQGFTGVQEALSRAPLTLATRAGHVVIAAGDDTLTLNTITGALSCQKGTSTYWASNGCPFSIHKDEVHILEDMLSIEQPSWNEPTPWRMVPTPFPTHMARFTYPAPQGAILGLPGQSGEFNRKGYRYDLYNTDQPYHIPSRPQMYQSWPIVMHKDLTNSGWVGVFHDNPARTFVDLGDFYKDTVLFESVTNNTRVYIIQASELGGITNRFIRLLGQPVFPPAWAFGYQQCRYSYMSSDAVRTVSKKLREQDIPCDAMYFDIDYMDGYRVFTKNSKTFGDLATCIKDIAEDGFKSVCIIDPGVKLDPGYPVYEELLKEKAVITDTESNPFEIVCWPGKAILPDFFDARVRTLWAQMQKKWLEEHPFDGLWNDMNEPSNFDGGREKTATAISSQGTFRQLFNTYGSSMAAASAEGWRLTNPAKRGVIITRSGYPGVQKDAVIWHGDNSAWWEHIRLAIDTCISYSLCGAFYTGPDLPGFFGNPSDDMAVRSYQVGSFLPLYRGHSYKLNSSKEPYAYSAQATGLIRDAIKLRYSLLTEWYSHFERCVREGLPPMEPLFTAEGAPQRDCFMLFDKFLVVGVTNRDEAARAVWLPKGTWYRLGDTATALEGGRWIVEEITLSKIPVFVRAGSIVVRNTPGKNVTETWSNQSTFEIYRDEKGEASGYLFKDDGISDLDAHSERFVLSIKSGESSVTKIPLAL